jgi:hypothetical protein
MKVADVSVLGASNTLCSGAKLWKISSGALVAFCATEECVDGRLGDG